jgi:flavin-dependent dehydrogenase
MREPHPMSGGAGIEPVVVIGAGLAGSAVAWQLAKAGCAPLMLERDPHPRHVVCGEFLSIEAQAELARLGIDLDRYGASRITTLRLVHGHVVAQVDLPFTGRGLSRKILDDVVRQEAVRTGARLVRGAAARFIMAGPMGIRFEAGRLGEIRAESLFLASGKHDIRGAKRVGGQAKEHFIAFKTYLSLTAQQRSGLEGVVEILLFRGGYAGLQLVEGSQANLCLIVTRSRFERAGRSWEALLAELRREAPPMAERLEGAAALLDRPLAVYQIPYGFLHRPQPSDPQGLFRLGDQVGVIPSLTGDGMAIALHSARLAASFYLTKRHSSSDFHRQIRADIGMQIRLACVLQTASHWRAGQRAVVETCRAYPNLARRLALWTRIPAGALERAETSA